MAFLVGLGSHFSWAQDGVDLIDDTKPAVSFKDQNVWEAGGFRVRDVTKNSLYEQMGIKNGDLIKKWNGKKITKAEDLKFIMKTISDDKGLTATVDRGGKEMIFHYPNEKSK